jgi:hypothetical protein
MIKNYNNLGRAVAALREALGEPVSSIARDASIRRFVLCVELSWTSSKP